MGFRRPLAFTVLLAGTATFAALAAQPAEQAGTAPVPAAASTASTASTTSTASPDAGKAAEAALSKLQAVAVKPGDATAGQAKAAVCAACHGPDGNSSTPMYPDLAGQSEQYITAQLMRFKAGVRTDPVMSGMAAPLSPQDMHDVGAYFQTQKPLPGVADEKLAGDGATLYHEGDASRGIPACMACHGPSGEGNPGWRVPQLAGQHADYIQKQLQAWHDGASWGSDTHATIMPTIAQRLTEHDIAAVSSYVEGLHAASSTATPAQPASAN